MSATATTTPAQVEPTTPPAIVWGRIASTGSSTAPAARLRRAWVGLALRRVYGLPDVALSGYVYDAEAISAREADTRDADTRAREYLAAYAALIYGDNRAEPIDRTALDYAAPDDAAQVAAGTRWPVGTVVTVDGYPNRWTVIERGETEARRFPDRVRVQAVGHSLNASTPLHTVRPVDLESVTLREYDANPADGCAEYAVHDAGTGEYVGEVWRNARGMWRAYRRATDTTPYRSSVIVYPTRADVLAAIGWHDAPPAVPVESCESCGADAGEPCRVGNCPGSCNPADVA